MTVTHKAYADDELAALYDLVYDDYDGDLDVYEGFARRADGAVLEIAAGSGRVALHLARNGHEVVALDSSPYMLSRLDARLDAETRSRVRLVEGDMRDFALGERFGLVYCAFFGFEHMLTADDQRAALRCVAAHLAPGGLFVMQLRSLTAVDWQPGSPPLVHDWTRADPDTGGTITKLRASTASPADQTTTDTVIFDRSAADGTVRRRTLEVTLRVTGRYELELLLESAGLRLAYLYGDTSLSPYTDDSDTMIAVATART